MPRRLKNTRVKNGKLQMYCRVHPGPGGLKTKTVERNTTAADVETWCNDQRKKYGQTTDTSGSFAAAAAAYFGKRADMPADKKKSYISIMNTWMHELGSSRSPLSIETAEINDVINRWIPTLAPGTIHNRRSVLSTFFVTMYPTHANPVRDAKDTKSPEPEARELSYVSIDAAIASMPDYRNGKQHPRLNLGKLRLRVQAETGLPPGMVRKIRPDDINFSGKTLFVHGREKGAGTEPRTLPLTPEAIAALHAFHAANAYGPNYRLGPLNLSFKRACQRIGIPSARVNQYILRHSFLTNLYRVTRDEATVQRLGMHAHGSLMTKRYTKAANPEIDRAAVEQFSNHRVTLRRQSLKTVPAQKHARRTGRKSA